jgi:four helix bundle protein
MGSASELEYHLLLAYDLGYLQHDLHSQLAESATEVKRMLTGFVAKLAKGPVTTQSAEG